jgi:hypothetical protein
MMLPPKVSRSTIAAHSLGSVNVFVQAEKDSLLAMPIEFFPPAPSKLGTEVRLRVCRVPCNRALVSRVWSGRSARWVASAGRFEHDRNVVVEFFGAAQGAAEANAAIASRSVVNAWVGIMRVLACLRRLAIEVSHRHNWALKSAGETKCRPGRNCTRRSQRSAGPYSGRIRATFSANHERPPVHPTRSAITVAGIVGNCLSSARTTGSICAHADVVTAARSYRGGASERTALATVFRDRASCRAIAACDSFSDRYSRRISAQSSTVITLQSKGAHFSTGITCSLFDRN